MADEIDRAQAREQLDRDLCIQHQARKQLPGLPECIECGGPISDIRQDLGARFCVPCQQGVEAEAKRRTSRCCL